MCHTVIDMPPDTATRLRQLRIEKKATQDDVAAAVNVDRSMISKMEKGKPGGREVVIRLADYYGVSLDWLLAGDGARTPQIASNLPPSEIELLNAFRKIPPDEAVAFFMLMVAASKRK